jgi:ATP-dependent DNA ligase
MQLISRNCARPFWMAKLLRWMLRYPPISFAPTIQQRQKRSTAPVFFYRFDVLWSGGRDLTGESVLQRRDRLEQIITPVVASRSAGTSRILEKLSSSSRKRKDLKG